MTKRRVLISAPYFLLVVEEYRRRLEAVGIEIICAAVRERLSEAELLPLIKNIDAAICGDDEFTEKVLRQAARLRVISKWGTGIDSIDHQAAAKFNVRVFSTANAFTAAVADTVLGYLLCFARRLPQMDKDVRAGRWTKPAAVSLSECTLGIVGLGNIGAAVARRAQAFGMQMLGTDTAPASPALVGETGIALVSLPELLEKSDFVTLHCDLNPTSRRLIASRELKTMRSTAYLINTARGGVVDEAALIRALQTGEIAGAALDVFETEPLSMSSPLRALGNCLLAPHNANSSLSARRRVHESTVANLLRGLAELEDAKHPPAADGGEFD